MKPIITIVFLFLSLSICFSQNLFYEVHGKHTRGVSKEKLNTAKIMMDIRPGFPSSMIEGYISTEISVTTNGNVMKATGVNDTLSAEQRSLLQTADVGSDIDVEIGYVYQNPVTLIPDIRKIHFVMAVVPEVEASYPGGYQGLLQYLENNAVEKINGKFPTDIRSVVIKFTVTETGEISNTQLSESSKVKEIDLILLETIKNMPKWLPAMDENGLKIPQEFVFTIGNGC